MRLNCAVTHVELGMRIYRDIWQLKYFWYDDGRRREHPTGPMSSFGMPDHQLLMGKERASFSNGHNYTILCILPGSLTTSSYVTKSNWSNTALCFARYLSRHCFFFLPNIEQLTEKIQHALLVKLILRAFETILSHHSNGLTKVHWWLTIII